MILFAKHLFCTIIGVGITAILASIALSSYDVQAGEMAYQKLWLGRTLIVFGVCSLVALFFDESRRVFHISVVWSLILLGGFEAIWGLKQLHGLAVSNHALYTLTGSFYNPGPYSGYLAMVFPICLYEWLNVRNVSERRWIQQGKYYLSIGVILLIVCVLPAGMSRSAWIAAAISSVWVYGMHASWGSRLKEMGKKYRGRALAAIITGGIILLMAGYALFHLKADSASGRLFMWKISGLAVAEGPLWGHGSGTFASVYGVTQENYFAAGNYTETEELVAGSPEYAFNEYLQIAVEYGVPSLILVLMLIVFCLWKGITEQKIGICGGVISILIFSFSSYPMQIPGFAIAVFFLLGACVIGRSKIFLIFFSLTVAIWGTYYLKSNQYEACKEWFRVKMMYNISDYQAAKDEYEELYPELKNRGAFLFEYGHCLHKLKEYDSSITILSEAIQYSSDPMILNIIGKNYQALGEFEKAEEWLIRSTHRLPGRIYPYYLLAKLYTEPEFLNLGKFKQTASIVLTKEPKVQSTAIKEMREEVRKLIIDHRKR